MRSRGALAVLTGARCFIEALTFAAFASIANALTTGLAPVPLVPTTLALFGAGLVLVTVQRERGSERRGAAIILIALAGGVLWGLTRPARDPDALAPLTRAVLFGLIAEAYLWRNLSIARGSTRWSDARNALLVAALAITLVALGPEPIDRGPLATLALAAVVCSALALSLARTAEELALARGTRGTAGPSSAAGASFVVGLAAIVAAGLVPAVQQALSAFGTAIEPVATQLLYTLLLPLGYVAAFLVQMFAAILAALRFREFRPDLPVFGTPEQDEAMLRDIERSRPFVFGAVELIIVAIAAIFAVLLLDRMLRERRLELPEGVTLERSSAEGFGLRQMLRGALPKRRERRHAPRDDGTPGAALRLVYWRFLTLAERAGAGWREPQETPGEHLTRIRTANGLWSEGEPIVRAFEDFRYGEAPPDAATLDRARGALRQLEDVRRAS